MTTDLDDMLDDLFHGCAFAAFVEQAIAQGGPPDMEATKRRAFHLYEEALASKTAQRDEGRPD
jgi:hypothetical protein